MDLATPEAGTMFTAASRERRRLLALWTVEEHLVADVAIDDGHEAGFDRAAFVEALAMGER